MTTDMSAKAKLQSLETALRERGVVDVKFFFDHANPKKPLTGVVSDVIEVLDAVVSNRYTKAQPLGDSVRANAV